MAEAQHNLGYVSLLGGDLVRAMREMAAARPAIAPASPANAAIGDVDMAEVLRDAGLVTDAERLLHGAALVFGRARMPQCPRRRGIPPRALAAAPRHRTVRAHRAVGCATFRRGREHARRARAEAIALRAAFAGGSIDRAGRPVADPRRRPADADVDRVARALVRGGLRNDAAALRLARELWLATHAMPSRPVPPLPETASLEVRLLAHEVRAARAAARRRDAEARRHAATGLDELGRLAAPRSAASTCRPRSRMHGNGLVLAGLARGRAVRSTGRCLRMVRAGAGT